MNGTVATSKNMDSLLMKMAAAKVAAEHSTLYVAEQHVSDVSQLKESRATEQKIQRGETAELREQVITMQTRITELHKTIAFLKLQSSQDSAPAEQPAVAENSPATGGIKSWTK